LEVIMPAGAILAIIIICVLIAIAAGTAATLELRMMATRRRFGPEFSRLERQVGARRARAELMARQRHVAGLELRPLPPQRSRELLSQWNSVQEQFVEAPAQAVATASELVLSAVSERGYPAGDSEQLLADLSVAHAPQLESFRQAQQTASDPEGASTEDLRQALLGYRGLLYKLADSGSGARAASPDGTTPGGTASGGRRLRWAGGVTAGTLLARTRRPRTASQPGSRAPRVRLSRPRLHLGAPRLPRVPRPSVPRLGRGARPSQRQGANQA
jgi:hypothetical protein